MSTATLQDAALQAILRGLGDAPAILADFVAGIPEDALRVQRAPGFWTIADHVAHLADVQPMLRERVRRILTEDAPEFVPFMPPEDAPAPTAPPRMDEALARFAAEREGMLELLRGARPLDWTRAATHPEYERYDLRILARHILMHDHWHMYRVEELWLTREAYLNPPAG